MKKNNNKGFMMAELLVVAVVVLVIFTILFTNFVPTKGEYEKRLEYNDIDTLYANYYLRVLLLRCYSSTGTKISPTLNSENYLTVVKDKTCTSTFSSFTFNNMTCQKIVDRFGISDSVITKYKPTSYKGPLSDYINYLDIESESGELFRLTTKTNVGYASSKFYSKSCGIPTYSNWSGYTIEECTESDTCEKSTKKVNIYNNGTAKPTNCDENPLCYLSNGNYYIINYPCDNDCTDMILYRTRTKYVSENEEDNFSITPCVN